MKPFGEDRGTAATAWVGERGFVGGIKDPTGLTHLGAREYDPTTGRFISVDPVADLKDPQQINGYAYSNNNPVTFADPDGKFFFALVALIMAVVPLVVAYYNYVSNKSSGSNGSGGMSTMGSANYGGSGGTGTDCSATYPAYKPGCNTNVEPADPRAEGSFKDFAASAGHAFLEGWEGLAELTPACWFQDCGAPTDAYDDFVEGKGVDEDSQAYDAGEDVVGVAGMLNISGWLKLLSKKLVKETSQKAAKEADAPNPGCTQCFLAGTDVRMADGSTKDIEDVEVGDEVLATDPETGETGARKVTHLIVTEDDKHFNELSIATEDGVEKLTATHEHPFWSPSERDWIEARDLRPGMTLRTDEGDTVVITGNRAFERHARTYNFTVADLHTYYVLAGETPVLVHNSSCPRFIVDKAGNVVELPQVQKTISKQKQDRHILNGNGYRGGGYFNSHADAQKVLDAYHGGQAQVMGVTKNGHIQIRVSSVTGYDNNPRAGRLGVATNIFMIKGTKSPSVVPMNPSASAP